jgi:branched-chain amino acid transport system permease protein
MRLTRPIGWVIVLLFLLLLPFLFRETRVNLAIEVLIYGLFAVSFNLLFGYGGMLPLGHSALFGVGAYCTALIVRHFPGFPLPLTFLAVALSGFAAGAFIGFFCVRLKGTYSALLSLGFQMFLFAVAVKWVSVTNGDDGMGVSRPDLYLPFLGSVPLMKISNLYYLTLAVAAIALAACYFFLKTHLGNSIVCIREKDVRASFLGYNVFLTRLTAFAVSGLFAAIAGGLFVVFQEFVAPSILGIDLSLSAALMAVIGGYSAFLGPVLGAAFYVVFQDSLARLTDHWFIWMGILFIVVVLYFPDGLIGLFKSERIRSMMLLKDKRK